VRQVAYLQRLYQDARSTERKIQVINIYEISYEWCFMEAAGTSCFIPVVPPEK
jgi:hypothetical protein